MTVTTGSTTRGVLRAERVSHAHRQMRSSVWRRQTTVRRGSGSDPGGQWLRRRRKARPVPQAGPASGARHAGRACSVRGAAVAESGPRSGQAPRDDRRPGRQDQLAVLHGWQHLRGRCARVVPLGWHFSRQNLDGLGWASASYCVLYVRAPGHGLLHPLRDDFAARHPLQGRDITRTGRGQRPIPTPCWRHRQEPRTPWSTANSTTSGRRSDT